MRNPNKTKIFFRTLIDALRSETGRNIVAWSANNRGNGKCNLHVAELLAGTARADQYRRQAPETIIRHGYTAHWQGLVTREQIQNIIR